MENQTPAPINATLTERLEWCALKMGGKRPLAAAADLSESQLYRYLDDESAIPHDKLLAIATAANVDAGWLLTGWGEIEKRQHRPRPPFRPKLLIEIQESFDLMMVEYQKPFPPALRSRAIAYLYDVLRQEEAQTNTLMRLDKFKMLQYISFLAELRTESELDVMLSAFDLISYRSLTEDLSQHHQLLTTWCNLLVRGMRGYYNSYAGQVYFDRMGQTLSSDAVAELHGFVNTAAKILGKSSFSWADFGCANGRHLAHLHKHMPNLTLSGIELSDLGVSLCHELIKSERLPIGCVQQGDMRLAPYKNQSFDVVYCRLAIQGLPHFRQGLALGMIDYLNEIKRVLKPKGVLILILPVGEGFDFKWPHQLCNTQDIQALSKGWQVYSHTQHSEEKAIQSLSSVPSAVGHPKHLALHHIVLINQ